MAISADAKFEGKEWEDFLKKINAKVKDINSMKEFGGIVSAVVYQDIDKHFDEEMGPEGPWAPWSKSYMQSIAGLVAFRWIKGRIVPITDDKFLSKNKPPRRPGKKLQATGRLRKSFTPNKWRAERGGILFYNNAKTKEGFPYAAAHNEGGDRLPKRQFMWFSSGGLEKLVDVTLKWLAE